MKTGRVIAVSAGIIVVLIIVVIYLVWTNLDEIVKAAIEKYGSQVSQTDVRVSSVRIKIARGEGAINGLTVGNPSGFSSPHSFSLGSIGIKIDTGTVTKDRVVIDEIRVSAPKVIYEINASGASNIIEIKKNVQESVKGTSHKTSETKKDDGKEITLLVRKLVVDKGKIEVHVAALDRTTSVELPRIQLNNIGKGTGATPAQVAEQLLSVFIEQVGPAVAKVGAGKFIGKSVDEVKLEMEKEAEKAIHRELEKALGSDSQEVEGGLKKLLGK